MVERQSGKKVKILRSDNGTEYLNKEFDEYLKSNGIKRQLSVPHTPQQNGVAERYNRTIVEMARTMLAGAGMDERFWAEAVACSAYLRNRSPSRALDGETPFEKWTGYQPSVKHLKIFGSVAIALNKTQNKKFLTKGKEYRLVGYSETSKAYRLYDATKDNVIVSRDVYFIETSVCRENVNVQDLMQSCQKEADSRKNVNIPDQMQSCQKELNSKESENSDESEEEDTPEDPTDKALKIGRGRPKILRRGERGRPKKQYNMVNFISNVEVEVPLTLDEAVVSQQSKQWSNAIKEEYNALMQNKTWEVVKLPVGKKPIGCKWVFSLKRGTDGCIERFKARLVAKGCSQKYGIDYDETYSPVVRYATIRMVLALAAEYELHLHQLDVSTAYLNGDLKEEVYMQQPQGVPHVPGMVLKLKKSLYGLKQSGRVWNSKLDYVLKKLGYKACESEPCLYTMFKKDQINLVAVYVDDLLLACSNLGELEHLKEKISLEFQIVDKGSVHRFLGLEIERESNTGAVILGQRQHILRTLKEFGMTECRTTSIPLEANFQVNCANSQCSKVDKTQYQSIIGSLMYIAITTRPDILHSVCKLSQRNTDPHTEHLAAAKQILRYLYTTADKKLRYEKSDGTIKGYADADWAGDATDRKSFTGYAFFMGGSAFSWECKKQKSVALSSTEAEYMALSTAAKEALYLRKLMNEIYMYEKLKSIEIHGDNLSAINLVKNPIYHTRSKHIDVKYHHVRDCFKTNLISLKYCPTKAMVADILTKNLSKVNRNKCTELLGLKSI